MVATAKRSKAWKRMKSRLEERLLEKIAQADADGILQAGTLMTMEVRHDSWCDLLNERGPCNCNPEICEPERYFPPEDN